MIEVFDEFAEENWNNEDEIKVRRKELKKTFDKLIRLCKTVH